MSSIKPKRAEYDVGIDAYGRPVILTFKYDSTGEERWGLYTEPVNLRDNKEAVLGLTNENLCSIAAVINTWEKTGECQNAVRP